MIEKEMQVWRSSEMDATLSSLYGSGRKSISKCNLNDYLQSLSSSLLSPKTWRIVWKKCRHFDFQPTKLKGNIEDVKADHAAFQI